MLEGRISRSFRPRRADARERNGGGARAGLEAGAEPAVALSAEEAALRQDLICAWLLWL